MFFILVLDYILCYIGSPCCNVSYYNYISIWPYYIVIHNIDETRFQKYDQIIITKVNLNICKDTAATLYRFITTIFDHIPWQMLLSF